MKKNEGGQVVAFQAVSSTDGSAVTTGSPTVYVTIDGGTQATGANTAIHEGQGSWSYVPTQAETDGDHIVYTFVLSGCINQSVNVYPVVVSEYQATGFSTFDHTSDEVITDAASRTASQADVSGLATQASVDTVDGVVDAILLDTGELQTKIIPMLELDGSGNYQYTALSLENAPSSGGGGGTDWSGIERSQIRKRLGIDGTTNTPIATPDLALEATAQAILADTNDLQTSQDNWLTADLVTLEATTADTNADLESFISTTTTNFANLDGKITTVDTNVDLILADTGELQTKIIPMLEDDGASGYQYTTLALENAPSGGGGGGDATLANQTTIINTLGDMSGATFDTSTDSLEAIRNRGDAAWVTGGGGGGIWQLTVTVTDTSANAVQGARVAVDGTSLTVTTDTSGEAVLNLNDGSYTINISAPSGYDDPAPQAVTISGADDTLAVPVSPTSGGGSCEIPPL